MKRIASAFGLAAFVCVRTASAQCGGTERWPVKVGADPGATQVDVANPAPILLHDLVNLPRPTLPSDETTRLPTERTVRVVNARLVKFKQETGKTGDSDFHLVISDDTLLYSAGGAGTQASPHSVIAEIADPNCVGGAAGSATPSLFASQLANVRAKFLQQFPNVTSGWNDAGGMPVRLTGVGFFDRAHGQVGRALNGLELHPLLDLEFNPSGTLSTNPTPAPGTPTPTAVVNVANPGFETAGGWTTTANVITTDTREVPHSGTGKAWLGGYGEKHTDRMSQTLTLPAGVNAISLAFFLHIDTQEGNQQATDKLFVRVRDSSGTLLRTLKTYSNQQAAPGYALRTLDLTAFQGRTVQIEFESREDVGEATSFVIDDVVVTVEGK